MDQLDLGVTVRGFSPNQKVFNRFVLQRILGRGGMGVVWLARDEELERPVALKFLPEIVALDPVSVAELKRETRRNLDLTHPHIVRIYDFVQDARSAAISMEYVDGPSVSALRAERPRGIFPLAELRRLVEQLADGLSYAHERAKVVHRDLKPANLMVTSGGDFKITDFGIATSISDSVSRISGRSTSGTAAYMSPQQMMGDRPAPTDDIYSVGATLYELLTGKPPFHTGNIIAQITSKVPPSIADRRVELGVTDAEPVPSAWESTIAHCLAKEPQDRPQSVRELLQALEPERPRSGISSTGAAELPATPAESPSDNRSIAKAARPEPAVPVSPSAASAPSPAAVSAPQKSRMPLFVALGAAGVIAVAVVAFVFSSRSPSTVSTSPQASQVSPDSPPQSFATPPIASTPRDPDPVTQDSAATTPATEPVRESAPVVNLTPRPADPPAVTTGSILVTSDPDDAEVTLGDITRRTPTQFQNIPAGRVTFTVAKPGYESRIVGLELAAGQVTELPTIKLAPKTYAVSLEATTNDVTYALDADGEQLRGSLPASLRLPAGRYSIRYARAGYGERNDSLVVTEEGARITADLRGGTLQLTSTPAGAEVLRAGRVIGQTPLAVPDLPPGPQTFEIRAANHVPRAVNFSVLPGQESTETVTLAPDPQYTYLMALQGHWAAGLNGLRFTDTSGNAIYRAGANFVKGRNFPMKLVSFDAATQTGIFQPEEPKLPTFEIVLRGGGVVLRWKANNRGKYYDVPMHSCTEQYFNKL